MDTKNLDRMNVKELRLKHRMSQNDLAEATGIPKGRINGWEQVGSQPKFKDYNTLKSFFDGLENKGVPPKQDDNETTDVLKEQIALLRSSLEDKIQIITLLSDKIKLLENSKK